MARAGSGFSLVRASAAGYFRLGILTDFSGAPLTPAFGKGNPSEPPRHRSGQPETGEVFPLSSDCFPGPLYSCHGCPRYYHSVHAPPGAGSGEEERRGGAEPGASCERQSWIPVFWSTNPHSPLRTCRSLLPMRGTHSLIPYWFLSAKSPPPHPL